MTSAVPVTSKLPDIGVSIFSVMTRLANEHKAINLSQGFPDFDCDPALVEAVAKAMREGHNQYAPMPGVLALREGIAAKVEQLYGPRYDPVTEVIVTSGATAGLYATLTTFVRPGDEVMLFEPCYDSYVPVIRLSGGVPVFVSLRYPDYTVNWDEVRRAMTPKTRIILVNTPHNPTGMMWSADDMRQLQSIVDGTDILLIGDEVYEHIIFDGRRHESLLRYEDLRARSVVISSFGKTFHTTGWKVGYGLGPQALMAEVTRVHQFVTFTVHTPSQMAFAEFVRRDPGAKDLSAFYQQKRDLFLQLTAGSRFKPLPCAGTYFQLMDYSAISKETDKEIAHRLIVEHGVASIPVSAFLYEDAGGPVLRFCFAKRDETLRAAAERLVKI
ncbi:MAG: aminotransferase class I/II-fold pyridoxal phosphate-dependent enzyme [Acidobacteria bacterium]|nr:aminotransferase class I/II-fold pyridoxal phosphate-dependent enzyme [Acidobacteriota bacterium]